MRRTLLIMASAVLLAAPLSAQAPAAAAASKLLPGTRIGVFSSIQGNAVNSTNGALTNTLVRLRDARYGHIVDRVVTDKVGSFTFRGVDPGNYVVEVMNPANEAVLDPFSVYTKGEALLRKELHALSSWHLVNIITAYDLSDEPVTVLNRLPGSVLIETIVSAVRERASMRPGGWRS